MKKLLTLLILVTAVPQVFSTIHIIRVWDGYFQFLPQQLTVELGDTIQWLPLDQPSMTHTVTSATIPAGAAPFDQIWQAPADTFFQYIPTQTGLHQYVCTPHAVSFNMVGEFMVNTPTGVSDAANNKVPVLYPNPAKDLINISTANVASNFRVISISGEIVLEGEFSKSINIKALERGVYFLELIGDENKVIRFLKQ